MVGMHIDRDGDGRLFGGVLMSDDGTEPWESPSQKYWREHLWRMEQEVQARRDRLHNFCSDRLASGDVPETGPPSLAEEAERKREAARRQIQAAAKGEQEAYAQALEFQDIEAQRRQERLRATALAAKPMVRGSVEFLFGGEKMAGRGWWNVP